MLNKKFKEIIKNLDENITNKDDLVYAKSQITELSMMYLDELQKIESSYRQKLESCEKRVDNLELSIRRLDNEIFQMEDEEDTDL